MPCWPLLRGRSDALPIFPCFIHFQNCVLEKPMLLVNMELCVLCKILFFKALMSSKIVDEEQAKVASGK